MAKYHLGTTTTVDSLVITGTSSFTNLEVTGNAIFDSHINVDGYTIDISDGADVNQVLQYNGTKFIAANVASGAAANANDFQLTGISATDVVSYTPLSQGNYIIYVFYRVATATTNVGINVTWTDNTGASTSVLVPAVTSTDVGSYNLTPVYINALTSPIKVTATAGTANNLYVSASIIGIS